MNRAFFLAFVAVVGGAVACAADTASDPQSKTASAVMEEKQLTLQDVRDAAMKRIANADVVRIELEQGDSGGALYKLIMVDDSNRYNVTVDAATGRITNVDKNTIISGRTSGTLASTDSNAGRGTISPERAKQIAAEQVRGVKVVGVDSGMKNNRLIYDIEMLSNNAKVDMQMDANTGEIITYNEAIANRQPGAVLFRRVYFNRGTANPESRNTGNQDR